MQRPETPKINFGKENLVAKIKRDQIIFDNPEMLRTLKKPKLDKQRGNLIPLHKIEFKKAGKRKMISPEKIKLYSSGKDIKGIQDRIVIPITKLKTTV